MSDSTLETNGLQIRYRKNKVALEAHPPRNHTVVLFHGRAFSLDNWYEIGTVETLGERGYPVYAIDLPSGTASKSDKVNYAKLRDYVPILEGIFSKLEIGNPERKVTIVGPSMGGGFALAYAVAHPEAVEGLVLISPAVHALEQSSLRKIKIPVMLVWGEGDDVFTLEQYGVPLRDKLENCRLVKLKNAGHAAYLNKPKEFNEMLLDFLEEISRKR